MHLNRLIKHITPALATLGEVLQPFCNDKYVTISLQRFGRTTTVNKSEGFCTIKKRDTANDIIPDSLGIQKKSDLTDMSEQCFPIDIFQKCQSQKQLKSEETID